MEDDDNRQFKEANAAVTRAVAAFVSEIESMFGKWEDVVAPSYLVGSRCWTCRRQCPS